MIDMNQIREIFEQDDESINLILSMYIEEYHSAHKNIEELYSKQKWDDLYMLTHSLYGTLAGLSEENVSSHLKNIENDIRMNCEPNIEDINLSVTGLHKIKEEISSYL
ncbi:hypothetical protein [Vibrio maerlii]|uniref:hypothetical protein n=1 Tax=Vibrio maerlii TaxID=2231648 RepID=UPI000E3D30D2|nr:hypothetical protein [Vibrio maerlii]